MPNNISYATIFQKALDEQMIQGATSGWMEANAGQVIYNGGSEVKIPKMSLDGLGNYSRSSGYPGGAVTLEYETKTMTQDRGRQFVLDSMDVNESNFVVNASSVMAQFQKLKVIPEVDAYRYSKISQLAIAKGAGYALGGYTPAVADILSKIKADIATVQDRIGDDVPLIIVMSGLIKNILETSTELSKQLSVVDFTQGKVNLKVRAINDCPIISVPSARLKTLYVFNDGTTAGQTAGGFVADAAAKTINWLLIAQQAPIAVSKTDNMKIFDPSVVQDADGYKLDYRKYHDIWIPDNKLDGIFANVKEALV
jgi:hypothetical protein